MNRKRNTADFVREVKFSLGRLSRADWKAEFARSLAVALLCFNPNGALAWDVPKTPQVMGQASQATVSPGESLYDVARRNGYAMEHLAESNGLPVSMEAIQRDRISLPSRRILPTNPPSDGVVVNLPERGFYVFAQGDRPRFFPIAVGEPGRFATPTGNFSIIEKVTDPDWVAPEWAGLGEDNVVPAGPDNPLGDRWIGLSSPGLGMHSTNNPSSIGSATSHGCMRMYPEIARSVFDLVKTGWPARIEYVLGRVALERSAISVSGFLDVYSRGGGLAQVRDGFEKEDLLGFFRPEPVRKILDEHRGIPIPVVDLTPKAWLGSQWFYAARIDGELYIAQGLLDASKVKADFSLAERSVKLSRGDRSLTLPLYVSSDSDPRSGDAFLSRGSGWFPARKTLEGLGLKLTWESAEKRLRVFE